ncbi:MAG: hypothetical protein AAF211_05230, partial [Myxococcota bacterium]
MHGWHSTIELPLFTWVWCTALTLVVLIGPLVLIVRRRDPSIFTALAIGAAFAFPLPIALLDPRRQIDVDEAVILPLQCLAIWAIAFGSFHALLAAITRGPPELHPTRPPRPGGLANGSVLLGAIAAALVVAFGGVSAPTGRLRPW